MSKAKKLLIFDLLLLIVIGGILYVKGLPFDLLKNDSEDIVVEDEITEDVEEIQEIAEPEPEIDPDEWNLVLVNPWNAIPEGYLDTVETVYTDGGYLIDSRVKDDLEQMLSDCRDAGYSPEIISAFRTRETQESLYNSTVNKNDTAVPGHSEHECGLAVDILESGYGGDWDNAEKTAEEALSRLNKPNMKFAEATKARCVNRYQEVTSEGWMLYYTPAAGSEKACAYSLYVRDGAFQTEEQYGGKKYYPRSFEDAFLFINPDADMLGGFDKEQDDWAYDAAKEIRNKKTSFALDVLIKKDFSAQENSDGWQIPPYIKEGLEWLAMD